MASEATQNVGVSPGDGAAARAAFGATEGLWEWSVYDSTVWFSNSFAKLLGLADGECQGELDLWLGKVHADDLHTLEEALHRCVRSGEPFDCSYRLRSHGDAYRWFRTRAIRYSDPSQASLTVSGGVHDIHAHRVAAEAAKERERKLMQRQRMEAIDCLAGGIAHEFNNVLQAIGGYVNFAREELPAGSTPHEDLSKALMAADRAAKLTRDLLGFAGGSEQQADTTNISSVLDALVELLRPVLGEDIELSLAAQSETLETGADIVELKQSLLNLCINARDAMPSGGSLRVTAAPFLVEEAHHDLLPQLKPGAYCRLKVSDSGRGISHEMCGRVFEPFFTTKDTGSGTGLGLAMVYGFAQRSAGCVAVHSDGVGSGADFSLYLPMKPMNTKEFPVETPPAIHGASDEPRQTVLLAEDDPLVQELGRRMLERAGYNVLTESDGEAALETYIENAAEISAVLLDAVMPRLNGRQVFEQIRRLQSGVPVGFFTGYDPGSVQGEALGYSADAVLAKPFDAPTLVSTVERMIGAQNSVSAANAMLNTEAPK